MTYHLNVFDKVKYIMKKGIKLVVYGVYTLGHMVLKGLKKDTKSKTKTLHGNYHCKMNHVKTQLKLEDSFLQVKNKKETVELFYNWIKNVKIQVKWWRIRVMLTTKKGKWAFDFPHYKEAHKLYEQLIYKKIDNKL